ncbi:queuosine biosynthesis protein QueC [Parelusimicrobium proximum]|uniref:7-cyano-7-deazaguanine synthase QueC n=1 Tax=Parelusimicrobium proximum TaxID=3228953 RepID=UPI003D17E2DB
MIIIATDKEQIESWTATAVIVDVLRSSTTVSALLKKGKKDVRIFGTTALAAEYKNIHPETEIYSELTFEPPVDKQDNSPFLASKSSSSSPALVVTTAGTKAAALCRNSSAVIMAGFCNFFASAIYLQNRKDDILLIPAALFGSHTDVEDSLCVEALHQFLLGFKDAVKDALKRVKETKRYEDFLNSGVKTAKKDADMCFDLNSIPVVPYIKVFDGYGRVYKADKVPAGIADDFAAEKEELARKKAEEERQKAEAEKQKAAEAEIKRETEEEQEASSLDELLGNTVKIASAPPEEEKISLSKHGAVSGGSKKAVVLFSGGLDSTVCLYWALNEGYECYPMHISYGQKHTKEIEAARAIAAGLGLKIEEVTLNLSWLSTSSLVGGDDIPEHELKDIGGGKIPSTYVPGRNLIFTSLAASYADAMDCSAIVLGPNAVDYSGYPDCREEFYKPLGEAVNQGTAVGTQGGGIKILTPIIKMSKADIVRLGRKLGVPLNKTWSCYSGGDEPCGKCDACKLRAKGFEDAMSS